MIKGWLWPMIRSNNQSLNHPQVGPGDDYVLTLEGFNNSTSTLGDTLLGGENINGMKFSAR